MASPTNVFNERQSLELRSPTYNQSHLASIIVYVQSKPAGLMNRTHWESFILTWDPYYLEVLFCFFMDFTSFPQCPHIHILGKGMEL